MQLLVAVEVKRDNGEQDGSESASFTLEKGTESLLTLNYYFEHGKIMITSTLKSVYILMLICTKSYEEKKKCFWGSTSIVIVIYYLLTLQSPIDDICFPIQHLIE